MTDRVQRLLKHLDTTQDVEKEETAGRESVTITDNRNGKEYEIGIKNKTLSAKEIQKIKLDGEQIGLRCYDPGFAQTAAATSRICYIDGPNGLLTYRGYPIEELANKSTFIEVAYLLIYGDLPTEAQLTYFNDRVMKHSFVHEDLAKIMKGFRYDAHPMGMLATSLCAMGTLQRDANPALQGQGVYDDQGVRNKQIHRLIGCMPTLAAFAYRHRMGRPYVPPPSHLNLTYSENFLYMLDKLTNTNYYPNKRLAKALDVLFILHAEHELNASTAAMRHLTSTGVDVYSSVSGAVGALYGPRHGGANEAVVRMLTDIGGVDKIPEFIEKVKAREVKLMGFGHRVYKNYDPRARIVRKVAKEIFDILGREPLIEVAEALEAAALSDQYFIKRKLYPNVDFYSGLIYKAFGFPADYFTVLFAIPRTVGWLSHWNEFLDDPENRIVRPRQVYLGEKTREYVPLHQRKEGKNSPDISSKSSANSRRAYTSSVSP